MKKLFTIKLSVVSNHSVDISRDRGVTINTGRTRREEKKGANRKNRKTAVSTKPTQEDKRNQQSRKGVTIGIYA